MRYLSVFAGIEAASVAWEPLGWEPVAFSEIEPFPCAVLAHHYPQVPNLGDVTRFDEWPEELLAQVDVIIGGSPCQSFSIAGLRGGLQDARGNLALVYVMLIEHIDRIREKHGRQPVVVVWENVVGVLSDKTNAFGSLVGALAGQNAPVATLTGSWPTCGVFWGEKRRVGYRVLDAQYFGVAQRRRRVFLVATHNSALASAGDRACPGEILSIADSLRGDTAPSRKTRQGPAAGPAPSAAVAGEPELNRAVSDTVTSKWAKGSGGPSGNETGNMVLQPAYYSHHPADSRVTGPHETADTVSARYGTGGGNVPIIEQPLSIAFAQNTRDEVRLQGGDGEISGALSANPGMKQTTYVAQPIPLDLRNAGRDPEKHDEQNRQGVGVGDEGDPAHTVTSAFVYGVAHPLAIRTANTNANGHGIAEDVAHTLDQAQGQCVAHPTSFGIQSTIIGRKPENGPQGTGISDDISFTLTKADQHAVAHTAEPIAFKVRGGVEIDSAGKQAGKGYLGSEGESHALATHQDQHIAQPMMFHGTQDPCTSDIAFAQGRNNGQENGIMTHEMVVRRLTPTECERLQGFPDGYTNIPWRNKPDSPDGARYKALGNSMATPVVLWVGWRIDQAFG